MAPRNEALTALSQALRLEREGRAFYLKAAEDTRDAKCRASFLAFADDERLHADMIERQLHAIEGNGTYVLLPDVTAPDIDLGAKLFAPARAQAIVKAGAEATDVAALHLALQMEINSYDLYRQAAQRTDDPAGVQMYRWLAAAEMTHFSLIMSNYEALVTGSSWV
jgi:rubrerythrin